MMSLLEILLIAALLSSCGCKAQNSIALNTTTLLEDFIIQNQRQYAATLKSLQDQVAAFKLNNLQQLKGLEIQSNLLEERLLQTEQRLNPLELLGGINKYCVQKYRNGITATAATVKSSFSSCSTTTSNNLASMTSSAQVTTVQLNNYYNNQLKNSLADCAKRYAADGSQLNHTLCATQAISNANAVTANSKKTFTTQMQQAGCSAETRIAQSIDCAFTTLYSTIASIGETMRLIDDCIAGNEFPTTSICPICDNTVFLELEPSDFKNATIANPFLGQPATYNCTTVQFQYLLAV